jgi:diguanylate cyclase (GGDEF)-like protein
MSTSHPRKQVWTALAGFLCAFGPVWSAGPGAAVPVISDLLHDQYTSVEGLPQNSVHSCVRTPDGYLWVATEAGLARFDGVRFQSFEMENTPGLPQDNIHFLAPARDGGLWVGTYSRGVGRLNGDRFVPLTGILNPQIRAILESSDGSTWIGTAGGLNRRKDGRLSAYTTKEGLASNDVLAVLEDNRSRLWIGTAGGLSLLESGKSTTFAAERQLTGMEIRSLSLTREGDLWAASPRMLARLREGAVAEKYAKDELPFRDSIQQVSVAADHSLWIATFGSGLFRLRAGRFEHYGTGQGLGSGVVLSLLPEPDGALWAGTAEGGLNRLRPRRIRMVGPSEGLSDTAANAVLEAPDGSLWIATLGHGLNHYRDGHMRVYTTRDGLSSDTVLSLLWSRRTGRLWVGTEDGALNWLEGGRFQRLPLREGSRPAKILEQPDGLMWAGTTKGLFRIENGAVARFYTKNDGLPSNVVLAIVQDRDGSLWLGTGNGLSHYENGRFTNYGAASRPETYGPRVNWVYEDSQGVLWLGSLGNGLGRFQDGRLTWLGTAQGLKDNVVYSVLEDDRGELWLSTNRGICRVLKRQLNDLAAGRLGRVASHSYGVTDGMTSAECNGDTQPAASKRQNGELLFACVGGVARLDPAQEPHAGAGPPVIVEQAEMNGRLIPQRTGSPRIRPGDGRLEFIYTAIDFAAPGQIFFRHRLEGVDQGWVEAGARRTASYTNIPPGRYVFHVAAENADGMAHETSMAFVLEPHFYQRAAFKLACGVLLLALMGGLYRWRTSQIRARQRELERLVQQRTAQLEESHRKLEVLATHDSLTQLWNRHAVMDILAKELARCQRERAPLVVALADLDHFKKINDTHGHLAGDKVLREVAQRFQSAIRSYDSAGRYGGEELLLVLPGMPVAEAKQRLRRIHGAVSATPIAYGDDTLITATCSLGVVCISGESCTAERAICRADAALYRAKDLGRNRIEYAELDSHQPIVVG